MTKSSLENVAEQYFSGGTREFLLDIARRRHRAPREKPEAPADVLVIVEEEQPED